MDGMGKYTSSAGTIYEGSYKQGLRHGVGKMIFAGSGDVYQGEWVHGEMSGNG